MRKTGALVALLLVLTLAVPVVAQQQSRTLTGTVFAQGDQPLPGAIVYLKNTKNMAIKTFIADGAGTFRFNALSPNVDYEVHAEHQGKKSDVKTLSSFDTRPNAKINLRIER